MINILTIDLFKYFTTPLKQQHQFWILTERFYWNVCFLVVAVINLDESIVYFSEKKYKICNTHHLNKLRPTIWFWRVKGAAKWCHSGDKVLLDAKVWGCCTLKNSGPIPYNFKLFLFSLWISENYQKNVHFNNMWQF